MIAAGGVLGNAGSVNVVALVKTPGAMKSPHGLGDGRQMMEWLGSRGIWILAVLWFICLGIFKSSMGDRDWRATVLFSAVTIFLLIAIMFLAVAGDTWR